ncbi:hypothetical protein BGAPBR_Q0073 (plasmid) [Borreliella garinii PBr]|uniref:Uncharacterized protein n=1 Tax=Borreliella garinii PBr TaxID=498743 RepID=B8F1F0_BORGR|nr:hypothetical protein BGAPBR_Q0073 [Borreliella garinii PBr]
MIDSLRINLYRGIRQVILKGLEVVIRHLFLLMRLLLYTNKL